MSLPVRGAWVEMGAPKISTRSVFCRSPCGERGLKFHRFTADDDRFRRSPCGERGLKYFALVARFCASGSLPVRGAWVEIIKGLVTINGLQRRSPCGERGLKCASGTRDRLPDRRSLPVRGAWVEIFYSLISELVSACRSPCGERGLKLNLYGQRCSKERVAPRAGSVG